MNGYAVVGEGEGPEKDWVELMERVIKRGFEMEDGGWEWL
jgi:hypothetical protein